MASDNSKNDQSRVSNKFDDLRKRSEFLYKLNPVETGKRSSREVQKLIEELRIHQIELEMQNDELRLAQYELISARDTYEDLYDSAPVGYLTVGRNSLILNTNLTFCCLINSEREKIINHRFTDFIPEDDQDKYYFHRQRILDTGQSRACELELVKADGTRFHARLDSVIDNISGEKDKIVKIIITDITEQRKLESQLRQSLKMEALGTLAGGIAHEFNNILHIMRLNLDFLESKIPTESPLRKNVETSQKTCIRAAVIIRQILSYSRKNKKQAEAIDVIPALEESVKLVRSALPAMIKLQFDVKVEKAVVQVEEARIHQIIYNLCSNAEDAMHEMGGNLEITVDEIAIETDFADIHKINKGTFLQLTVVDDGIGIDNTDLERIFDPFFTTKTTGEGTGLGLSVVHGIIRDLGGAVTVSSKIGEGSRFYVFLPLSAETVSPKSTIEKPVFGGNEQILIVDDDEGIIDIHTEILEDLGYQVTAETSSVVALELFKNQPHKFDMVLTDHGMPEMTGIQLAKELLLIRNDIPIALLSGYDDTDLEKDATQTGICRVIMKPLDHEQLGEIIRDVLNENEKTR
ncbi:MAG: response regulator [Deltaproteobacteria bacterium]|nr:response regulator [Deltaproteobacteria bacterium]